MEMFFKKGKYFSVGFEKNNFNSTNYTEKIIKMISIEYFAVKFLLELEWNM